MKVKKTTDLKRDIFFTAEFMLYLFLVLFVLPKIFLLAGGGIENTDNLTKFMFYSAPGAVVAIFLILIKWIRVFVKVPYLDSVIHDPEESLLYNIPYVKNIIANPLLLILGSLIFFSGLVYIERVTQTALLPKAEIPFIQQQVTETADIGLHVYPASPAETLELALVITFILIGLNLLKHRFGFDDTIGWILKIVIVPFIGALLWMVYHIARYGSSDIALTSVFGFGYISTLLIVLTNSIIPALVLHDINNLFVRLFELISSDFVLIGIVVVLIILSVSFISLLVRDITIKKGETL